MAPTSPKKSGLSFSDRLLLRTAEGRVFDGLWIGVTNVGDHDSADILARVETALKVIRTYDPRRYHRLPQYLQRVWVRLQVPGNLGAYNSVLAACELDLRYVVRPDVQPADLASTVVHEATHARLDRFGYTEPIRARIEAACRDQERAFADRLPQPEGDKIREKLRSWEADKDHSWSDATFRNTYTAGIPEALRYMKIPKWLVPVIMMSREAVIWLRRLTRNVRGRRAA